MEKKPNIRTVEKLGNVIVLSWCILGVLLWGPPGCAKTCLVRAAASSCSVNILSASSAEIYSPYVGAAEAAISELFQRARHMTPAIIFLDELGKSHKFITIKEKVWII